MYDGCMKFKLLLVSISTLLVWVGYQKYAELALLKTVNSYESCLVAKGSTVLESYPVTCRTQLGNTFTQPNPSPSANTKPVQSPKDYSNDYSLSLPSGWYQAEKNMFLNYVPTEEDASFIPSKDKGKLKVEVVILSGASSLRAAVESQKVYDDQEYSEKPITVDGQPAILVENPDKTSMVVTKNPYTNDIYMIQFFLDFDNYKSLRNQIITTLKFTRQ